MIEMNGFPFRLGTTSYIIPADILSNVRYLAGKVRDVELVLFDVDDGMNNLPSPDEIEQLLMIALLEDDALVQYNNAVCRLYGREPMGDEDTSRLFEDEVQRCLDLLLGEGVDAGGGFIQNKNRGSLR